MNLSVKHNVAKIGLQCIGCGICEGVCTGHAIKVIEKDSIGIIPVVDGNKCIGCGVCLELCPVFELSKPENLNKVRAIFRGHSKIKEFYLRGSSGGVVSSILYYLFNKNIIDAALVAFLDSTFNAYGYFISSKEEVLEHAGSYYLTCKQLLNIAKIHRYRSVAIVGLPCHIEAIELYVNTMGLKNIALTISLFCTIGRMRAGYMKFLQEKFNKRLYELNLQKYISRYGRERPGIMLIITQKEVLKYSLEEFVDYFDYFYTPIGCFNCRKMYGLSADISVGDDWSLRTQRKIALISANSERGLYLLTKLSKENILELERIDEGSYYLLKSQGGALIKIYRPQETKILLYLVKFLGLRTHNKYLRVLSKTIRRIMFFYLRLSSRKKLMEERPWLK